MKSFFRLTLSLALAITVVLGFTTIILVLSGAPPFKAYYHIIMGSLGSWMKFSRVVSTWIPLTLCACGLLCTFRIGLWNIGVEGQIMMGAVLTLFVLRLCPETWHPSVTLFFAFAGGICGGALWALFAGVLKTKGGVNEIFAGLGLNFLAQGIILWLIFGPWKRPGIASMSGTEILPQKLWLPNVLSIRLPLVAVILSIISIFVTALMLKYSTTGLKLKAIGKNYRASSLYGLNPDKYMVVAMIFAGGFAGLAGSIQVTGVYHRLIPAISSNYGYLALLVVMLANYHVLASPVVAFFFACLNVGSIQLPMMLRLDSSLAGVIQGAFVLAALMVNSLKNSRKPAKGAS